MQWAEEMGAWSLELVRRPPQQRSFQILPRRWIVERTFGWLNLQRRLSKDYEGCVKLPQHDSHRDDRIDAAPLETQLAFLDTLLDRAGNCLELAGDDFCQNPGSSHARPDARNQAA